MLGVLIVKFDAFANLCGGNTNDRIGVGIVVSVTTKNFHAEYALFQLVGLASENPGDNKPQKARISFAGVEQGCSKQLLKLLMNGLLFDFTSRNPTFRCLHW